MSSHSPYYNMTPQQQHEYNLRKQEREDLEHDLQRACENAVAAQRQAKRRAAALQEEARRALEIAEDVTDDCKRLSTLNATLLAACEAAIASIVQRCNSGAPTTPCEFEVLAQLTLAVTEAKGGAA